MKKLFFLALPFLAGLVLAMLLLILGSSTPLSAIRAFFLTPFSNAFYIGNLLDSATLILICALGFLFGMRMGIFNLGGEGQSYLGALIALEISLNLPAWIPAPIGMTLGFTVAIMGVGLIGLLSALVRNLLHINELITTFLLSSAIIPLIDFGVAGPLRNTAGSLLATPAIPESWQLFPLLSPSTLNIGLLLVPLCVIGVATFFRRTRTGYEMRLCSDNPEFAKSQGVAISGLALLSLSISAGFHGLAGAIAVYGSYHAVFSGLTAGLGWNGIAAALIGRSSPLGALIGAVLFAWLGAGAQAALIHTDFTFELAGFIQGTVFLLITMQNLPRRGLARKKRHQV